MITTVIYYMTEIILTTRFTIYFLYRITVSNHGSTINTNDDKVSGWPTLRCSIESSIELTYKTLCRPILEQHMVFGHQN